MLDLPPSSRLDEIIAQAPFIWKDFSRFVAVAPVERGWLVLWGVFRDGGRSRELAGSRDYLDLPGARRRVADAVFELTRDPALAAEAVTRFDRTSFPRHSLASRPEPR